MNLIKKMVMKKVIIVVLVLIMCSGPGYARTSGGRRRNKLFSFNTLDGEISVDLEFSIPFISIPVKKTMENFGAAGLTLPTINVNVAALALGGAVLLGTVVILPLFIKSTSNYYLQKPYARLLDNAHFGSDFVLDFANQLMMDSSGLQRCALRVACWAGKRAPDLEARKMINQVSGNSILSAIVNATAMEEAMSSGRRGGDCLLYRPCPIRDEHMPFLIYNLGAFGKG